MISSMEKCWTKTHWIRLIQVDVYIEIVGCVSNDPIDSGCVGEESSNFLFVT